TNSSSTSSVRKIRRARRRRSRRRAVLRRLRRARQEGSDMVLPMFERWGLNPREQRVATVALFVFAAFFLLAIPVGLQTLVSSRRAENEDLRTALAAVNNARA